MSAPEKIYVLVKGDFIHARWETERVDDEDIEYIRADKVDERNDKAAREIKYLLDENTELRAALEAAHKAWCEVTYSGISFDAWLEDMKNDSDCQRQKALGW